MCTPNWHSTTIPWSQGFETNVLHDSQYFRFSISLWQTGIMAYDSKNTGRLLYSSVCLHVTVMTVARNPETQHITKCFIFERKWSVPVWSGRVVTNVLGYRPGSGFNLKPMQTSHFIKIFVTYYVWNIYLPFQSSEVWRPEQMLLNMRHLWYEYFIFMVTFMVTVYSNICALMQFGALEYFHPNSQSSEESTFNDLNVLTNMVLFNLFIVASPMHIAVSLFCLSSLTINSKTQPVVLANPAAFFGYIILFCWTC